MYDVIIIGGGPAGLNGALILARCLRKVLIFDSGAPRNRFSNQLNGFLTRDNISPSNFLKLARKEILEYGVEIRSEKITCVHQVSNGFTVENEGGQKFNCKKILLATGLIDNLPEISGIEKFYGKSVFHCPYCDGFENKEKKIAVYGKGKKGFNLALSLLTWSRHVTLFSDGKPNLKPKNLNKLKANGVNLELEKIAALDGTRGKLKNIILTSGKEILCDVMFFATKFSQHSEHALKLGCKFTKKGIVKTDILQQTNVPGVYVAGDAARDVQLVIVAAGEGAKAGIAINTALQKEERKKSKGIFHKV